MSKFYTIWKLYLNKPDWVHSLAFQIKDWLYFKKLKKLHFSKVKQKLVRFFFSVTDLYPLLTL